MHGFCKNMDLGTSHLIFFKQKLTPKSIYMLCKSCRSSHTDHSEIGFAIFGFFFDFIRILQGAAETHQRVKKHFANWTMERSKASQPYPWFASRPLEVPGTLQCGPWTKGGGTAGQNPATSPAVLAGEGAWKVQGVVYDRFRYWFGAEGPPVSKHGGGRRR
jgi:hypothetical protein